MKRKINIGFAPSVNFSKVTLDLVDHEIEFETEAQFEAEVARLYGRLSLMCKNQFELWGKMK